MGGEGVTWVVKQADWYYVSCDGGSNYVSVNWSLDKADAMRTDDINTARYYAKTYRGKVFRLSAKAKAKPLPTDSEEFWASSHAVDAIKDIGEDAYQSLLIVYSEAIRENVRLRKELDWHTR